VRPKRDLDFAPREEDVGMVALLLGEFADSVYEGEGGFKVGELVRPDNVMLIYDSPLRGVR
jgi:hypothetical protein